MLRADNFCKHSICIAEQTKLLLINGTGSITMLLKVTGY